MAQKCLAVLTLRCTTTTLLCLVAERWLFRMPRAARRIRMSQVLSWSLRGAICATGILGAMAIAACGGDDGTTPPSSGSSSGASGNNSSSGSSGSTATPQGPCNGKPVNDCGGCTELPVKIGTTCATGYNVCKGSDAAECKAGDGPPVTALTATTNLEDKVSLSWTAPTTLTPTGYIVSRDGAEYGSAGIAKFDDTAAEAAKIVAPSNVQASDGTTTDKVTVTWTAASTIPAKAYKYTVTPLYTQNGSTLKGLGSNEATGNRAAPAVTGYEVKRDNGAWLPAGASTSFDDKDAPAGTVLSGLTTQVLARGPSAVVFRATVAATPVISDVAPSTYSVRAKVGAATLDAANSDAGFRKKPVYDPATATLKWQRSSADGDFGYADLAGQTFTQGLDLAGATDGGGRFYRPALVVDGTSVPGPSQRAAGSSAFKSVELFSDNGCGVRLDDTVACWGTNSSNVVSGVPVALKAKKVVVGPSHACAIKSDNNGVCWGSSADNRSTVPAGVIKDMAVSDSSSCFIKADDTLQCSVNVATPPVGGFKRVYRAPGNTYCATRMTDDTVCWGSNNTIVNNTPTAVKFKALAGGQEHFCGITDSDKLQCWGTSDGAPYLAGRAPFVGTPSVDTYKSVSAGAENTCATRADDTLECWGRGSEGHFVGRSPLKFKSLANGNRMACGVDMNDRFYCARSRNQNTLGPNEVAPQLPVANAKMTFGGTHQHNLASVLTEDGKVHFFGNIGYEARTDQYNGAPPTSTYKYIEQGGLVACGIKTDDTLECWGQRQNIPASLGATTYRSLSMIQGGLNRNARVMCAVRAGDNVMECYNGGNAVVGAFKHVAVAQGMTCGIRTDDTIACATWGNNAGTNRYGIPTTPPVGTFKAIYPSRKRGGFCAVTMADTVTCWGPQATANNDAAQTFQTGPNAILTGEFGFCGVTTNGQRKCVGTPGNGLSTDKFVSLSYARPNGVLCGVRADKLFYCEGGRNDFPRFF
jgi:hypothetical protein